MEALARAASPPNMRLFTDPRQAKRVWEVRESSLGAISNVPGEPLTWEGWEDRRLRPQAGPYLRDLRKLMDAYKYRGTLYGHFGDGCVHTRISFDMESAKGIAQFRKFMEEAADLVVSYGGTLSGEHGDGQSRAELLPKMFGPELVQAFREFKANLGSRLEDESRQSRGALPHRMKTCAWARTITPGSRRRISSFPDDHGSLARATLRCVGVGSAATTKAE